MKVSRCRSITSLARYRSTAALEIPSAWAQAWAASGLIAKALRGCSRALGRASDKAMRAGPARAPPQGGAPTAGAIRTCERSVRDFADVGHQVFEVITGLHGLQDHELGDVALDAHLAAHESLHAGLLV